MARTASDPNDLIRRLEAALKQARPRDTADARLMADIVGMTWRNLLMTHIEPDPKFPIERRGSEGVPWEFRVVRVLRHMLKRAREKIAANDEHARKVRRLTSFTVPEAEGGAVSMADLSRLADLTIKAQGMKERQKLYVPADTVRDFLSRYNARIRDAILGTPARLDPTGALDPSARAFIDDEMRNLAVTAEQAVQEFLREWSAGLFEGGTG
ncbi:MAG: hypothetical protein DI547_04905 [Sphingobium sp.]|nr:MAG: hypothetical protein DI547_04905 [Sphingobium sp.]